MKLYILFTLFVLIINDETFVFDCKSGDFIGESKEGCFLDESHYSKETDNQHGLAYACLASFKRMIKKNPPFTISSEGKVNEYWKYRSPGMFSLFDGGSTKINICVIENKGKYPGSILFLNIVKQFIEAHENYVIATNPSFLFYTFNSPDLITIESFKNFHEKSHGHFYYFYSKESPINYIYFRVRILWMIL